RAQNALTMLRLSSRTGAVASSDDLGCESLLLNGNSRDDIIQFIERTLGPLLRYDHTRRGASLVETLSQYFASNQNTGNAAERLGIHPKTMAQRMERISHLLGKEWREPQQLLQVQVALRVQALIEGS